MSEFRYWFAIVAGAFVGFVLGLVLLLAADLNFFLCVILGYMVLSFLAQLIWWSIPGLFFYEFFLGIGTSCFDSIARCFGSGNAIGLMFGVVFLALFLAIAAACIVIAFSILFISAMVVFPIKVFTIREEVY